MFHRSPASHANPRPYLPTLQKLHIHCDLAQYIDKIIIQVPTMVNVPFVILSHNAGTEPANRKGQATTEGTALALLGVFQLQELSLSGVAELMLC